MQTFFGVLIALAISIAAISQTVTGPAAAREAQRALESLGSQTDARSVDAARRRAAEYEAHQFELHMQEFARVWNDFVKDYESGTYNLKKARALSKALRKLESELPE
jgi:hypothetical protein